jgi:hypothetical protein
MRSTLLGAIVVAAVAAPAASQPQPSAPAPDEPAGAEPAPADDVDSLRQEYLRLRDELYQSRARAATVASALYSTKISIKLAYQHARFYTVDRATIRLDGASVYDDTDGAIAADDAVRFEGWIAPGRHVVSIRVEATGKDDDRFSSATEATFVVQAVGGKDLVVVARAGDGGDLPYQWKRGERGTYRLSIDADVKTVKRAETKKRAKAAATREPKRAARKPKP